MVMARASIVLTMPPLPLAWPTTCGSSTCAHQMCVRWREAVKRRCTNCDQPITSGQRFIEHRDPFSNDLVDLEHEHCAGVEL